MTSNLGAREFLEAKQPNQGFAGQLDDMPKIYQNALKAHFRPEFLNRVDEIIAFRSLERSDLYGIADIHLGIMKKNLYKQREVNLELTPEAVELILAHGYQPAFGARPLQRAINTYLSRPLAEYMLRQPPPEGASVLAMREEDKIVFKLGSGGASTGGSPPPAHAAPPPPQDPVPEDPWAQPEMGGGAESYEDFEAPEPDTLPGLRATPPPSAPPPPREPSPPAPAPPPPPQGTLAVPDQNATGMNLERPAPRPAPSPQTQPTGRIPDRKDRPFTPLRSPKRGDS